MVAPRRISFRVRWLIAPAPQDWKNSAMVPLLYVTIDGLLDHIGFSQVVRVVEGLQDRGFAYSIVSLERARDLANDARVRTVRSALAAKGIAWTYATYREGGASTVSLNLTRLLHLAAGAAVARRPRLVHARAYHGALVASVLQRTLGIPYLFDARGLWIDERIEEGRWFTTPARERVARRVERALYRNALAIVTLTKLHASDVIRMQDPKSRPPVVIPTCADYDAFRIEPSPDTTSIPESVRHALVGRRVLAIIGSLNRAYLGADAARFVRATFELDANARLLVLSHQDDAWRRCLVDEAGVAASRVIVTRTHHEQMPSWLSLTDLGLLFLTPDTVARRGMMPTKLAEMFAAGVRPVVHGCNEEVRNWVRQSGTGIVLDALNDADIARAAALANADVPRSARERARAITAPHFSLRAGIDRYATLLEALTRA